MPRGKNYKKKNARKVSNRRSNPGRSTVNLTKGVSNVIAPRGIVKLRYADTFTLDPGVSTPAAHRFNANGLYDPDAETGGHQPMGFDQWMEFYNHYTVLGSRITCQFSQISSNSESNSTLVGIHLNDDINWVPAGLASEIMETPYIRWQMLGERSNSKGIRKVSKTFSAAKFFGKSKNSMINDGLYRGDASNNPNEDAVYHVFACGVSASDDPGPIECTVVIEYLAYLTEPKTFGQS